MLRRRRRLPAVIKINNSDAPEAGIDVCELLKVTAELLPDDEKTFAVEVVNNADLAKPTANHGFYQELNRLLELEELDISH